METHCSWPVNRVLYGYEISQQNASNTWPSLNMLNSFLWHYMLAQAPQLQLGLAVCPDCQWDHAKTAEADVSLWKGLLMKSCSLHRVSLRRWENFSLLWETVRVAEWTWGGELAVIVTSACDFNRVALEELRSHFKSPRCTLHRTFFFFFSGLLIVRF